MKFIRPKSKNQLLDEYVKEGGKIYRTDVNRMGFNMSDRAISTYCFRKKIKMKKVNEMYWEKVESNLPLKDLLKTNYSYIRNPFTEEEKRDILILTYADFHKKYPNRPKTSYDSKIYRMKKSPPHPFR